jgi:hypothetical protein
VAVVPAAVAVAGVVIGAYLLGQHRADHEPVPAPHTAPAQAQPVVVAASDDPTQSAVAWLRGYRSVSYADPAPTSWIARVSPVVAGELAAEYTGYRDGTAGPQWTSFTTQRCVSSVPSASAVIPAEAPRTAEEVYVQVEGDVTSACDIGEAPGGDSEHAAATLELRHDPDGRWRVERRIF